MHAAPMVCSGVDGQTICAPGDQPMEDELLWLHAAAAARAKISPVVVRSTRGLIMIAATAGCEV
jgi:hypothetical protein